METSSNGNGNGHAQVGKRISGMVSGSLVATVLVAICGMAWNTMQEQGRQLAVIQADVKAMRSRVDGLQKRLDRITTMKPAM